MAFEQLSWTDNKDGKLVMYRATPWQLLTCELVIGPAPFPFIQTSVDHRFDWLDSRAIGTRDLPPTIIEPPEFIAELDAISMAGF